MSSLHLQSTYPRWMQYTCVLLNVACVPLLIGAVWAGASVPIPLIVAAAVISDRATLSVVRPVALRQSPLFRLANTAIVIWFSRDKKPTR